MKKVLSNREKTIRLGRGNMVLASIKEHGHHAVKALLRSGTIVPDSTIKASAFAWYMPPS